MTTHARLAKSHNDMIFSNKSRLLLNSTDFQFQNIKARSHVRCKRKWKRNRRSHVERKRKQNEIRTRISVFQDGGNLVPGVRVTLDQQSGNEIKDGGRSQFFKTIF